MSRKNDAIIDKGRNGARQNTEKDSYQPYERTDSMVVENEIEDETIDISNFGRQYMAQHAESEEAKRVAGLMAEINSDQQTETQEKSKSSKHKINFGFFSKKNGRSYKEAEFDGEQITDPAKYEENAENAYGPQIGDFSAELDRDFDKNEEEPDEYERQSVRRTDLTDSGADFDESVNFGFGEYDDNNDELDGNEDDYEDEQQDEEDEFCETVETPEEQKKELTEDAADDFEDAKEESNSGLDMDCDKRTLVQKLKDFWYGTEDFEEKFGEDFDPSVFDRNKPEEESGDGKKNYSDKEITAVDKSSSKAVPDRDGDTQYAEENGREEAQTEENSKSAEDETYEEFDGGKLSLLEKLRAFWNGDDIRNRDIDEEEITDEEIEAARRAENYGWGSSSIQYDDLSEYAPKQRSAAKASSESDKAVSEELERETAFSLLLWIKSKVNSFLNPTLSVEEESDETIAEEETEKTADEGDDENETELKKSSPLQQIKELWNEDGEYADEEDASAEDDETLDAEYADENESVATKPVLTVIELPVSNQHNDDEADGERTEAGTEQKEEKISASEKNPEKAADSEEDIISEGPDAPESVVTAPIHRKKPGVGQRLKSFWNGGNLSGGDYIPGDEIAVQPQTNKKEDKPKKYDGKKPGFFQQLKNKSLKIGGLDKIGEFGSVSGKEDRHSDVSSKDDKEAGSAAQSKPQKEETDDAPEIAAVTFEEAAGDGVKIDEVDGRQIINGRVVPRYTHESLVEKISLANENLPLVVRHEYEEYIRQAKYRANADDDVPKINSEVSRAVEEELKNPKEPVKNIPAAVEADGKTESDGAEKTKDTAKEGGQKNERRSIKDILFGSVENSADFSEFRAQTNLNPQNDDVIEDYDKPSDARAIRAEINYDNRKVTFRCVALSIIFVITLALYIIQRYIPELLTKNIPSADIMTCLISLIMILVSAVLCHSTVIGGLKPLLAFKGNSDTATAVAAIACTVQGVISFFEPQAFFSGGMHLYAILAIAALLLNNLGKLCIVRRIKDNFKFVSSPNRKYAARIYEDEEISKQMIDQTGAEKPVVALQNRTRFLKGFLRFSYMPDPSERLASAMAPVTTVIAVLVAIICGISRASVSGAISSFALVACMAIPVCCLLAVNIPMKRLCKDALKSRSMIIGYPAVKQFAETRAVMVDSRELYPRGKVQLLSVKTFNTYNIDKALLNAAAVMKVANTPMTYMFEDVISEKGEHLPEVESVKYEDGMGIVSWVGGERLLLGNRDLMKKYAINLPSIDFEESSVESKSNCITYLANAGELVAMLVTEYQADKRLAAELKRLENNGVTVLIRTADPNVSAIKVARDFGIFIRSIKILPTELGNVCKDEMSKRDESTKAFVATEGKLHSLARAISGCIKIKDNISIAIVIQVLAVILGVLIASVVSIFAELNGLNGLDLLFYIVFWAAASIIAPMIQKP